MKKRKKAVIALVLALAFVLAFQTSLLIASALSTNATDGPAVEKGSFTGGEQNSGSDGFYDHNGRGTRGWSSYDNINSALEVGPEYSFKPYIDTSADANGPATECGYFGSPDQSGFDEAIEDNETFTGTDRGVNSGSTWGFKARGDGKASEGTFGVTVKNARIRLSGQINPVIFDLKITCTDYTVDGDVYAGYTPFIGIQKNSVSPNITLIGVKEASFKFQYFLPGTSTPFNLNSNLTYGDIDDHQYIAIDENDATGGVFLGPDTKLNYGMSSGMHLFYANFDEVTGAGGKAAFGVAFQSGSDGLVLSFGNNESSVSSDATEEQKKAAFDYAWFGGSAYLMWKPPVPPPFKTVTDSDEPAVTHDTLIDENEYFTYVINQNISSGYTSESFFGSFVMSDRVDTCLDILRVRVRNIGHSSSSTKAEWNDADGQINDEWFAISVTPDNVVTATAKKSVLDDESFYGGSGRIDTVKQLEIRVRWKPGLTDAQKEAHGHRITGPAKGWRVANKSTVTIDGAPKETNEVITDCFPPEKKVLDADEGPTDENTLTNANEPFRYDVSQYVPAKSAAADKYTAMKFTDTIEQCLMITGVKVVRDGGADVTALFTDSTSGNSVVVSAKAESLTQASFYGHTYTLCITARLRTDVTEATLRAHGHYVESDRYLKYENRAAVSINDRSAVYTDTVTTKAPVPDLEIEKTVSRYENQVGDVYRYTIKVRHTPVSQGDAVSVRIWDDDIPQGVTISGLSLSGLSTQGRSLTPMARGFILTADVLKLTETAVIQFDCAADRTHNGTLITNAAFVYSFSDTSGDWTKPKSDDAEVYINSPKLNVVKSAQTDGGGIEKGEEIHYEAVITNINPGTFMRGCIFYDEITQSGIRLMPGSIAVKDSRDRLITGRCDITVSGNAFWVEPVSPLNLAYADKMVPPKECGRTPAFPPVLCDYGAIPLENRITVTYSVNVSDPELIGSAVINKFTSPSRPNTNGDVIRDDPDIPSGGDDDTKEITVYGDNALLAIEKAARHREYAPGDTIPYIIRVTAPGPAPVKNVVITDGIRTPGVSMLEDTIKVYYDEDNITSDCAISVTVPAFEIMTYKDLAPPHVIKVEYETQISTDPAIFTSGTVDNESAADGDNVDEVDDTEQVLLDIPEPGSPAQETPTPPAISTPPAILTPPAISTPSAAQPTPPAVKTTPAAATPETPEKEKSTPDKSGGKGTPKTGDNFPLKLAGIIATVAAATLYFLTRRYRKLK